MQLQVAKWDLLVLPASSILFVLKRYSCLLTHSVQKILLWTSLKPGVVKHHQQISTTIFFSMVMAKHCSRRMYVHVSILEHSPIHLVVKGTAEHLARTMERIAMHVTTPFTTASNESGTYRGQGLFSPEVKTVGFQDALVNFRSGIVT